MCNTPSYYAKYRYQFRFMSKYKDNRSQYWEEEI